MRNWTKSLLLLAPLLFGMVLPAWSQPSQGRFHAVRLRTGQDVKVELVRYITEQNLRACAVVSCVGSLTEARIRYADQSGTARVEGPLEIVGLVGCGGKGYWHLHITVSDQEGRTQGGHLVDGCRVRTTAEIVLVELQDLEFQRTPDPETGYDELEIVPREDSGR